MIRIIGGAAGAAAAAELGALAVVVDALRSSATVAAMLAAGASEVLVCADPETARGVAAEVGDALLAGEWRSSTPEGFDLGNSPVAAAEADLSGRRVVFTSSNGAPMLVSCCGAGRILMGGATNAEAVVLAARAALAARTEVVIVPAGDMGGESEEDFASAVLLAEAIGPDIDPGQAEMLDRWRERLAGGLEALMRTCPHGLELAKLGFDSDLAAAATQNLYPVLPEVLGFRRRGGAAVARVGIGA